MCLFIKNCLLIKHWEDNSIAIKNEPAASQAKSKDPEQADWSV